MNNVARDIFDIVRKARQKAYSSVNSAMVDAYWQIGRRIVEEDQQGELRAEYGKGLIQDLSRQLSDEFGKGFSVANLKSFRQFYLTFQDVEKSYTLCSQLSWSHLRLIMRVDNEKARDYYITEAARENWSVRQLQRNINTLWYERLLTSADKKAALAQEGSFDRQSPREFIKDPYVLEFLQLPEHSSTSEGRIESAIIDNLQHFLLELGKGFSFVGRQYRVSTETKHFFIDLVFYNFILKCFVLIDLKADDLTHQDIGQMDMYVRLFEDRIKGADDNPTIGIILCTEKDETIVKYSVLEEGRQLFASKYRLVLPTEDELRAEIERERRVFMEMQEGG